jgi:hypothetical protein
VWLSPWGGYAQAKQDRVAEGRRDGYEIENGGFALSGPKYYARFHEVCMEMVKKYGVNQFKFDGTGNADTVVKSSDPRWLAVYGWASWTHEKAILTLRNPSDKPQDFQLDVAQAFELPVGAARRFRAHSPWHDEAAMPIMNLQAGAPHTFHLQPFQVLTLEAVPE